MRNQTSAPQRLQRAQPDSDRRKKSWRTVQAARVDTQAEIIQFGDNPQPGSIPGFDLDRGGEDACEKRVQRTAINPILMAMMGNRSRIHPTMHMLMLLVRRDRHLKARRIGQRRRHDPRELGDQEQANQHADKAGNGP
jgi:hypothetical protein